MRLEEGCRHPRNSYRSEHRPVAPAPRWKRWLCPSKNSFATHSNGNSKLVCACQQRDLSVLLPLVKQDERQPVRGTRLSVFQSVEKQKRGNSGAPSLLLPLRSCWTYQVNRTPSSIVRLPPLNMNLLRNCGESTKM